MLRLNTSKTFLLIILILGFVKVNLAQETWQEADSIRASFLTQQNFSETKKYAELAIDLVKKKVGDQDTLYADMNTKLMEVSFYTGQYDEAINCLLIEKEIRLKQQGELHPLYGECLSNLGLMYKILGRYNEALPIIKEGVRLGRLMLGDKNPELGIRIMGLANIYTEMEEVDKSLPLLMEAKGIFQKLLGENSEYHLNSVSNLAHYYSKIDDLDNALKYSLKCIQIVNELDGENNRNYGTYLNNLADLYEKLGTPRKAEPIYNKAVQNIKSKFGIENVIYGRTLANLGHVNQKIGNYELAEKQIMESLNVLELNLTKEHILYIISLNNYGYNFLQQNNYKEGLTHLLLAEDLLEKIDGEHLSRYCVIMNNIGNAYKNLNQVDSAIHYYKKGIERSRRSKVLRNTTNLLNFNLAKIYDSKKEYNKSYDAFEKAINGYVEQIDENFSFMSEEDKEAYFSQMDMQFSTYYGFIQDYSSINKEVTTEAYNLIIKNKGALLKSSARMRMSILNSNDTLVYNLYDDWIEVRKKISKLYTSSSGTGADSIIVSMENKASILERQLVKKSQSFAEDNESKLINFKDIKNQLKSSEVVVEFIDYSLDEEKHYSAFLIDNTMEYPIMINLFKESELENLIGKFGGNNLSYINDIYGVKSETNKILYDLIWDPLNIHLKGVKKVYISPSGLLHKISFAAIKNDDQQYLSDFYVIEMITSSANLVNKNTTTIDLTNFGKKSSVSIYGGINYNTQDSDEEIWSYLKGTKSETENIEAILKSKEINYTYHYGNDATETEFKGIGDIKLIHFATHGFFFPDPNEVKESGESNELENTEIVFRGGKIESPHNENFVKSANPLMRSGLVLAGANDVWNKERLVKEDDGMLTALEVSNMNLSDTKLVVLSACETGLGDIKGSEGVYGLQRALKMAGVNFIMMSLWQVPDKETEEFMTLFYKNLVRSKNIRKSFNKTQKIMRKKYDPYYWAAFVLME